MTEWQLVALLAAVAAVALVIIIAIVVLQYRLPQRADEDNQEWKAEQATETPLQAVRSSLIQQQDIFRSLMLSARREYLQLANAERGAQQLKEVSTWTQLTLLELEELEGDFARTLDLKKRAEAEVLKLAQELQRDRPLPEEPATLE